MTGIETSITVPFEGAEVMATLPSRAKTSSRIEVNPMPSGRRGSSPTPSSETRKTAARSANFNYIALQGALLWN